MTHVMCATSVNNTNIKRQCVLASHIVSLIVRPVLDCDVSLGLVEDGFVALSLFVFCQSGSFIALYLKVLFP